jgi:hypothetical protein
MVTRTYDHDLDETVNLLGNGDRYVFTRDAYVYADNSWAIYEDTPRKNNRVVIDGILEGADNAGGVLSNGANFELDIGVRGIVSGGTGVQLTGANADIDNSGYIFTMAYGIYSTGNNARIHNSGLIDSVTGIYADGDKISIVNDAGAMIRTSGTGIQLEAGAGEETRTVNHSAPIRPEAIASAPPMTLLSTMGASPAASTWATATIRSTIAAASSPARCKGEEAMILSSPTTRAISMVAMMSTR